MSYAKTVAQLKRLAVAAGPYALIELVLPGGTLISAALWLVQRKLRASGRPHAEIWRSVARCGHT